MAVQLERERPILTYTHRESATSLDVSKDLPNSEKLPDGVAPETYELLLFARDHKEILDKVDSLDERKRIKNLTRNLIGIYFGSEASIREVTLAVGISRKAFKRRILDGLEIIWQNSPPGIKSQLPKEKAVRLKEPSTISPLDSKKRSQRLITLWQNEGYREKTLADLRNTKNSPEYIRKIKKTLRGKKHSEQRVVKIRNAIQEYWDKRHGIEFTDNPLAKRSALVDEWFKLNKLLGHPPSYNEIRKLSKEGKTKFSQHMYIKEFGEGSFREVKKLLAKINPLDIKRTDNALQSEIGKDERSTWVYAVEHGLIENIKKTAMLTAEELDSIEIYHKTGLVQNGLNLETFDRLSIAVAKLA